MRLDIKKKFFTRGGEILAQVSLRICACTIIGSVQGRVAWALGQLDLVREAPAHDRKIGLDGLWRSLPIQTIV